MNMLPGYGRESYLKTPQVLLLMVPSFYKALLSLYRWYLVRQGGRCTDYLKTSALTRLVKSTGREAVFVQSAKKAGIRFTTRLGGETRRTGAGFKKGRLLLLFQVIHIFAWPCERERVENWEKREDWQDWQD